MCVWGVGDFLHGLRNIFLLYVRLTLIDILGDSCKKRAAWVSVVPENLCNLDMSTVRLTKSGNAYVQQPGKLIIKQQ